MKMENKTKIFCFETSRGVYQYIAGTDEKSARSNFPALKLAPCVGEVPADEFCLITKESPFVLFKKEAKAILKSKPRRGTVSLNFKVV